MQIVWYACFAFVIFFLLIAAGAPTYPGPASPSALDSPTPSETSDRGVGGHRAYVTGILYGMTRGTATPTHVAASMDALQKVSVKAAKKGGDHKVGGHGGGHGHGKGGGKAKVAATKGAAGAVDASKDATPSLQN